MSRQSIGKNLRLNHSTLVYIGPLSPRQSSGCAASIPRQWRRSKSKRRRTKEFYVESGTPPSAGRIAQVTRICKGHFAIRPRPTHFVVRGTAARHAPAVRRCCDAAPRFCHDPVPSRITFSNRCDAAQQKDAGDATHDKDFGRATPKNSARHSGYALRQKRTTATTYRFRPGCLTADRFQRQDQRLTQRRTGRTYPGKLPRPVLAQGIRSATADVHAWRGEAHWDGPSLVCSLFQYATAATIAD